MGYVDWMIKGPKFTSCSCDYGCPCEFNARPTRGDCEGLEAHRIDEGHFGDVPLAGLVVAAWYRWPGPVHEGGGVAQPIIDARADERQREALLKILDGEEQEPTTVFNIYGSTMESAHEPIFTEIEFECDMAARTARLKAGEYLDLRVTPIRNPVTGKHHRARIVLPEGFEFRDAEAASGDFAVNAARAFAGEGRYAAIWHAAYGPQGLIADA